MAAGGGGDANSRSMEETPTWAVAVVCLVLVVISVLIEHAIHLLGKWLKKHHKRALYEALEKIKSELMLMGFISFLLTVSQSTISKICVPMSVGDSWHPCKPSEEDDITGHVEDSDENTGGRKLLQAAGSVHAFRRVLASGGSSDNCAEKGKVALISGEAINQLHIFIFVLAVSHVLYCIYLSIMIQMRRWKTWEMETRTPEYQFTHGWQSNFWHPFIPLIIILMVGTKLQVIITKMAIQIMERGDVVKGVPVVQPRDNLFWFNRPGLLLFLIHFVLFQNAFQLAFFAWSWYEFGYPSCFHKRIEDIIIRISMGILIQVLCSYVILPLYALVTQMGTNLKPTIFSERVATALRKWHHTARKNVKESRKSGSVTPYTSRPTTPSHSLSPVHLLQYYHNEADYSDHNSTKKYFVDEDQFDPEGLPSPSGHSNDESFSQYRNATLKRFVEGNIEMKGVQDDGRLQMPIRHDSDGHTNSAVSIDFSFDKMEKGKTQV